MSDRMSDAEVEAIVRNIKEGNSFEPDSSTIKKVYYDPTTKNLLIEFKNGGEYLYREVDPTVYQDFLGSESAGRFFASHIKDVFEFQKVPPVSERAQTEESPPPAAA